MTTWLLLVLLQTSNGHAVVSVEHRTKAACAAQLQESSRQMQSFITGWCTGLNHW
ncbi:hypothetical protein [uncultured Haliea sp.]|uniref:hypothetical protein n=1 Tax=uncultured Haliea sp. TaxID=622616 RepID=UPI002696FF5E|tara:strand:- start:5389 stop:5553 length:165 start_codon:yes stop_codon:yes gene_type:complete